AVPVCGVEPADTPPHPQAPSEVPPGPACCGVGPGGGRSELQAERRWRAASMVASGGVLSGGGGSLAAPLFGQMGTNRHSPHPATAPKSLIFHAPRLIRTADLLIRRPAGAHAVRVFSRTSASRCYRTSHANGHKRRRAGTRWAQPYSPRNLFLARTARTDWT